MDIVSPRTQERLKSFGSLITHLESLYHLKVLASKAEAW